MLTVLFQSGYAVLSKYASQSVYDANPISIILNIFYILSFACLAMQALVWQQALKYHDLSYAYPYTSLVYIIVIVCSVVLFHEQIYFQNIIGILLIVFGICYLSRSMGDNSE